MAEEAALDALRDMFRYHAWATLRLIDFCAGLPPEQLGGSVPGTRGPILDTLRHIVRADYGYKMRFKVHSKPELEDEDVPSLERMRAIFAGESEVWLTLLGRLQEFDITIPANPQDDPPWPEAPHARNLLLIQAIHHGNDHRTQICTILGSKGLEIPWMDSWGYWASERAPRSRAAH